MKSHFYVTHTLLVLVLLLMGSRPAGAQTPGTGNILYVNKSVSGGNGNGSTWGNAIPELADALKWARQQNNFTSGNPLKIYVAKGIYYPMYSPIDGNNLAATPSSGDVRDRTFLMVANVELYGGFDPANGIQQLGDARILGSNSGTVLSGDFNGNDVVSGNSSTITISNNTDNAHHVVLAAGTVAYNVKLDGFVIKGGGIGSLAPNQITVGGNIDTYRRGGSAVGMFFSSASILSLSNCKVSENYAFFGTLCIKNSGTINLYNTSVSGNNANYAIAFSNNPNTRTLNAVNSTIAGNYNFYIYFEGAGAGVINVDNCIIYENGNTAATNANSATKSIRYSLVQGEGSNLNYNNAANYNLPATTNPLFSNSTQRAYSLMAGSPAINAGSNSLIPGGITTDLVGNLRIMGSVVDMGAYEYFPCHPFRSIYVDSSATGTNDGTSWANAYTSLSDAITKAHDCSLVDSILVAKGTYYPDLVPPYSSASGALSQSDRSFYILRDSLIILGGYPSGGGLRAPDTYITVLSGDLDRSGTRTNNDAYHVLLSKGTVDNPIDSLLIDGFTITMGNARITGDYIVIGGDNVVKASGAGMYNGYASPLLKNMRFSSNYVHSTGAGMYNTGASPIIEHATFSQNVSHGGNGAGMYNAASSSPVLTNVTFHGNTSSSAGGAVYNHTSNAVFNHVTFSQNTAGNYGGAVYNNTSSPVFTHVIFAGNSTTNAGNGGGALYNNASPAVVTNALFSGNNCAATGSGGGIYNHECTAPPVISNATFAGNNAATGGAVYNTNSNPVINNSIIYANSTGIYNAGTSVPAIMHSLVQGASGGSNGNINGNISPRFSDTAGGFGTAPFTGGNYRLQLCSPAINAGNNSLIPGGITTDLAGNPRPYNTGIVDMGAYEYQAMLAPRTLYVDSTATGTNDGSSWANAYTSLSDAITIAHSCTVDSIRVAKGTYYPTTIPPTTSNDTSNRDRSFYFLRNNLVVSGGYPNGGGTRNHANNPTILSADLDASGNLTVGDAYHVMLTVGTADNPIDSTLQIDGFTIRSSYADDIYTWISVNASNMNRGYGGGMYNRYASPRISNIIFRNHWAITGGGMYNSFSSPIMNSITFTSNFANSGGGMYNTSSSNAVISNATFSSNSALNGGGMYNNANSAPRISNTSFSGNMANAGAGGGMYSTNSSPTINNTVFSGNTASNGGGIYNNNNSSTQMSNSVISGNTATNGGGMLNNASSPTISNTTIAGNRATNGGAMYNVSSSNPAISNTIIYANSTGIFNSSSTPVINYSIVQGYTGSGTANLDTDPLFVSAPLFSTAPFTGGNYRLQFCSPAINAGNNSLVPGAITTDLAGNPRIAGSVDMGAYESAIVRPRTLYVDYTATGTNDGSSWANAYTSLSAAITQAHSCNLVDSILVAKGTYYPTTIPPTASTPTTARDRSFYFLRDSLVLLGGYPSGGGARNYKANPTILSGDIGTPNVNTDNTYHVLVAIGSATNPIDSLLIDGFTVTSGNANAAAYIIVNGYILSYSYGGGMNNYYASPHISNCSFSGSNVLYNGGAMLNDYSSPRISNCSFSGNRANHGGAIYNAIGSPSISNSSFSGNRANAGGVMYNYGSPSISNSIIYGNSSAIANASGTVTVAYSIVEGGYAGTGNLNIDPLFVNAPSHTTAPFTGGDYHLLFCSPAINAGDNSLVPAGITTDLAANPRTVGTVDMGAYEKQSDVSDFGNNATLSNSSSNMLTFIATCDNNDWTWYADPNNPDSLSFAIRWGTNNNAAKAAATLQLVVEAANTFSSTSDSTARAAMRRYWNVNLNGSSMNEPVSVRFFYNAADTLDMYNQITSAGVGLPKPLQWVKTVGNAYNPSVVTDTAFNGGNYQVLTPIYGGSNSVAYVQFDGLTSFSGGTSTMDAGDAEPLPLDLLNFRAKANGSKVQLNWAVATNENISRIEVERSQNGKDWSTIYSTKSTGSNLIYQAWDNSPYAASNYYRLKVWDNADKYDYSHTQHVLFKGEGQMNIRIYPNPNNGNFCIEAYGVKGESAFVSIQDMMGKTISSYSISEGKTNRTDLNLAAGTYMIRVQNGGTTHIEKLIVR